MSAVEPVDAPTAMIAPQQVSRNSSERARCRRLSAQPPGCSRRSRSWRVASARPGHPNGQERDAPARGRAVLVATAVGTGAVPDHRVIRSPVPVEVTGRSPRCGDPPQEVRYTASGARTVGACDRRARKDEHERNDEHGDTPHGGTLLSAFRRDRTPRGQLGRGPVHGEHVTGLRTTSGSSVAWPVAGWISSGFRPVQTRSPSSHGELGPDSPPPRSGSAGILVRGPEARWRKRCSENRPGRVLLRRRGAGRRVPVVRLSERGGRRLLRRVRLPARGAAGTALPIATAQPQRRRPQSASWSRCCSRTSSGSRHYRKHAIRGGARAPHPGYASRTLIARYGDRREVHRRRGDGRLGRSGGQDAQQPVRAALELTAAVAALGDEVGAKGLAAGAGCTGRSRRHARRRRASLARSRRALPLGCSPVAQPGSVFMAERPGEASEASIVYEDAGADEMKGKAEPGAARPRAVRVMGRAACSALKASSRRSSAATANSGT